MRARRLRDGEEPRSSVRSLRGERLRGRRHLLRGGVGGRVRAIRAVVLRRVRRARVQRPAARGGLRRRLRIDLRGRRYRTRELLGRGPARALSMERGRGQLYLRAVLTGASNRLHPLEAPARERRLDLTSGAAST